MCQNEQPDTMQPSLSVPTNQTEPWFLTTELCEDVPQCYWAASLKNGIAVYLDDRKDLGLTAWQRLKKYCESAQVDIDNIRLQFRSHMEILPQRGNGYFFINGSVGIFGMNFETSIGDPPRNLNEFRFGILEDDGKVYVNHWLIPELIINGSSVKELNKCKENIIFNSSYGS